MVTEQSVNNRKIAKNTIYLYLRMFFVMALTLYISRAVLSTLGVVDYGIYNVVSGFVSLFGFLNATLAASMQRFYNYEIGASGHKGLPSIYSVGIITHIILIIILLIVCETFGVWYINNIMVIPSDRLHAAHIVYQSSVFSMVILMAQIPYLGIVLAYEKMDFYAFVSILEVVLKLIVVILLPKINRDHLILYAVFYSLISLVSFCLYFLYSKKNFPFLRFSKNLSFVKFKEIISFSGWNLLGTFAWMINGQGQNLILNMFFGPVINAARGIAYQVQSAVNSFLQSVVTAFRPQIVDSYAKEDYARVKQLFYSESRICLILMFLLVIPLMANVEFIINIWLGSDIPEYTCLFTVLVLFDLLISSINPCIGQVAHANGQIKRYQIANSLVNICLLPISYLVLTTGADAVTVFILTILFSILNQVVCLVQLTNLFDYEPRLYVCRVILPCVLIFIVACISQFVVLSLFVGNLARLFVCIIVNSITVLSMTYMVALNKDERKVVFQYMSSFINKFRDRDNA